MIAEIPVTEELLLVTEDADCFYYGDRAIDRASIVAVRVLINGSPIAAYVSTRHPVDTTRQVTSFEDRPEGIARDRWDVAIETANGHDAGRVRRDPGARLPGARARGFRRRQAASVETPTRRDATTHSRPYHSVSGTPRRDD